MLVLRADGKQVCCRPGSAVQLLLPAVNPALAGENLAIYALFRQAHPKPAVAAPADTTKKIPNSPAVLFNHISACYSATFAPACCPQAVLRSVASAVDDARLAHGWWMLAAVVLRRKEKARRGELARS
jgi:hypothetical protein